MKPEFAYKKEVDGTDKEAEELLVKQLKMSLKDVVQDQMECLHRIADVRTSLKLRDYLYVSCDRFSLTAQRNLILSRFSLLKSRHAACREGNRPTYQSIVGRIARDSITHDGDNLLDLEKYSSAAALPDILGMATSLGYGNPSCEKPVMWLVEAIFTAGWADSDLGAKANLDLVTTKRL